MLQRLGHWNCFKISWIWRNSHLSDMLFSQKLQWVLLLQDCFNIQKCDLILITKDIASNKGHFEVFPKEKEIFFIMPLVILFWFGHALLHFVMLLLTYSAPRTRILSSTTPSPRFGDKNWNLLFTYHYSLSLFTYYYSWHYSLRNFAYLRGVVPYISSKF